MFASEPPPKMQNMNPETTFYNKEDYYFLRGLLKRGVGL